MSKYQLAKAIQEELNSLNKKIDQKILRGLSYRAEAQRHKALLGRLIRINKHESRGFLSRISSVFHISKFA